LAPENEHISPQPAPGDVRSGPYRFHFWRLFHAYRDTAQAIVRITEYGWQSALWCSAQAAGSPGACGPDRPWRPTAKASAQGFLLKEAW